MLQVRELIETGEVLLPKNNPRDFRGGLHGYQTHLGFQASNSGNSNSSSSEVMFFVRLDTKNKAFLTPPSNMTEIEACTEFAKKLNDEELIASLRPARGDSDPIQHRYFKRSFPFVCLAVIPALFHCRYVPAMKADNPDYTKGGGLLFAQALKPFLEYMRSKFVGDYIVPSEVQFMDIPYATNMTMTVSYMHL